jgi:hypothetical protein
LGSVGVDHLLVIKHLSGPPSQENRDGEKQRGEDIDKSNFPPPVLGSRILIRDENTGQHLGKEKAARRIVERREGVATAKLGLLRKTNKTTWVRITIAAEVKR